MLHSIQFDPKIDNQSAIVAAIAALYGTSVQIPVGATTAPADDSDDGANSPAVDPATLDGTGIPHDVRIHSDKPNMTDKGVWRKRKGVAATTVAQVTAELLARIGGTTTPATPPAAPQPPAPPAAPAAPAAPPAPPPAANKAYTDFVTFVDTHRVTPQNEANPHALISAEWLASTLQYYGIASGSLLDLMNADPAKIAEIQSGMRLSLGYTA